MSDPQTQGDLALQVAQQLQEQQEKQLESIPLEVEEDQDVDEPQGKFKRFRQFSFSWKIHDRMAVSQIEHASDALLLDMFGPAIDAIDRLYRLIRVPETDDSGVPIKENGRVVWKLDGHGNYLQDLDRATGQDFEEALLAIAKVKLDISPRVSDLFTEAVYAKHVFDDAVNEHIGKSLSGTDQDKKAKATTKAIQDKYMSFFAFTVWNKARRFQDELDNLERVIDRVRNWRSFADSRKPYSA